MLKKEGLVQLEDQTLENVSGGLRSFEDTEYKNAGVIIAGDGYFAKLSTGEEVRIDKTVANSMVDCYHLNGQQLRDGDLKALIEQCRI